MKRLLSLCALILLVGCPTAPAPVTVSRDGTPEQPGRSDEIHIHVVKWGEGDTNGGKMQSALATWFRDHPDLELVEMVSDTASGELVLVAVRR